MNATTTRERQDVTFKSGDDSCAAWLYRPAGDGPHAMVLMAHGLGGVKEQRLDAYAERFRDAGYAALVFDYRFFGESTGEPRQLLDIKRQLEDWQAALDFARGLEDTDPDRIVVWGTSFGGGHALVTAARNPGVAAAIAQCPFTDGLSSGFAVSPLTSAKIMPRALADAVGSRFGRAPIYVPTYGPPNSAALMTAPDAEEGVRGITPDGFEVRPDVAARIALEIIRHTPGREARKIACPTLYCVCEPDSVAPAKATLRHAARTSHAEVRLYDEGHFDIYVGRAFERVVSDQVKFLQTHVPA